MRKANRKVVNNLVETDKYGTVEIIEEHLNDSGYIFGTYKILNTGYIVECSWAGLQSGGIRDAFEKTVCDVACCGYAKPKENTAIYNIWLEMIKKCYKKDSEFYNLYGKNGFYVNDNWLRFDIFLNDYNELKKTINTENELNTYELHIKPELLENGCKEFSMANCTLIDRKLAINFGEIYHSNGYGDYIPIKYIKRERDNRKCVLCKFVLTGTEVVAEPYRAKNGILKDNYYPKIYGVGYIGHGSVRGNERAAGLWSNMMSRCYNTNATDYARYGGCGVRVDERWHNLGNFLDDIPLLNGYDKWLENKEPYHLDKDLLQAGVPSQNKVYSKNTCCFLSFKENTNLSLINCHNKSARNFYNVEPSKNGYYVSIVYNKKNKYIGSFNNEVAAANARDWYINWYKIDNMRMNSDIGAPYMPPEEWLKYRNHVKPPVPMYEMHNQYADIEYEIKNGIKHKMYDIVGPMKDPWDD